MRIGIIIILLSVFGTACAEEHREFTFVHLNDTYRIGAVEDGTSGGFGRVATLVRELSANGEEVRLTHGGDFLYPSLESQIWDGEQMIDAFNFLDALAPMIVVGGNHEFDKRTPEVLKEAVRQSTFDWVGGNYEFQTGDADVDSTLLPVMFVESNGAKLGFFGLTLHDADGGNARSYVPIDRNYLESAKASIQRLRDAGADAIIGVTHVHMYIDEHVAALKASYPELAFIVGGHEHEPEFSPGTQTKAPVMKGASNARQVWVIRLKLTDDGPFVESELVDIDASIHSDPAYDALHDRWRTALLARFPFLTARVGTAAVPLDGREVTIRNEESNWGNFVVDQMRTAFGREPADLAFLNSGTLRIDDWIADDITFEDIARTFGFSSFNRYLDMRGADFRATLEAGYRGEGPSKGYFPQVSGFRVCVDRRLPDGERIVSLQIPGEAGWDEIGDETIYSVVVSDYLFRGGDGYTFPPEVQASKRGSELKYLVLDAIVRAQAEERAIGEPVDPSNPRMVFLSESRPTCWE